MKSLIIVYAAALLIICLPTLFLSIDNARTESITQNIAGVATSGSTYIATVNLGQPLYNSAIGNVSVVSSNLSSDSPSADNYTVSGRIVSIGGLDESQTRTIALTYAVSSSHLPSGVNTFLGLIIWFLIFIEMGLLAGAIYAFFQ